LKGSLIDQARARILAGIGLCFGVIMAANALRSIKTGDFALAGVLAFVGISMMLIPFLMRKTGSVFISSNLFIFIYFFMLAMACYRGGGGISQIQYNFAILLVAAFLLCGVKNGAAWAVMVIALVVAFRVMAASGFQFPADKEKETVFVNLIVIVINVSLLAGIFAWSSAENLKRFAVQKQKSDDDAAKLNDLFTDVDSVMSKVAEGDLSLRVKTEKDQKQAELKNSINVALDMLSQTISKVISAAHEIDSGTSQVSKASQTLASGSAEQAASIEEISSSMDEIGFKAKTNSENAGQAQSLSKETSDAAVKGNKQMEAMLASMNKINETSSNVSKVVKVIDEIAFQTNLLALNAAVEAARAGKYGKGFAVVADEVRNLASRSAEAAKDTTELIENSIVEVENGVRNANQTAEILKGFVESISKVADFVAEISTTSQEQATGAGEINTSLTQVNEVVQQNSSISEETASASEQLSSQAAILIDLMNQFKLTQDVLTPRIDPQTPKEVKKQSAKIVPTVPNQPRIAVQTETKKKIVLDDDDFGKY
jgi:methyl-accepting chemotaxis protein